MQQEKLFDINEVCKLLGTTSRTLRFYEQKGIVESTKSSFSSRRQYTAEQVEHIRCVLVLRTLGLSVKAIAQLGRDSADLHEAVLSHRAQIYATIETRRKEISLLNEAVAIIESGKSIFDADFMTSLVHPNTHREFVVRECSQAVIFGESQVLYEYLSDKMKSYMPPDVYERIRDDTLAPLGKFVALDRLEYDRKYPNALEQYIKFERLGLKLRYVFHDDKIHGFWMNYYEL